MYKYFIKNKLVFLSLAAAIAIYTLLKYREPSIEEEGKNIDTVQTPNTSKVSEINLHKKSIIEQVNNNLEQDKKNYLIDNEIISGKIDLPEVAYNDISIDNSLMVIDEKNTESLEKYKKGSVIFNQTMLKHPSNKEYNMPGSYPL